jgi:2,4-dienoyl-CoA reductase-like NADH-dependent reductase (Old Yellow Enzyme family)/thioredoxin reductase
MRFPKLFEEGHISNMRIRNRTVMPPMGTNLASETGAVTPAMIHYYRERAKGGVGLIITEINSIDSPQGCALPTQLSIHDNAYIAGHNELVEAVKEHGAKIITQLHHAGRQTTEENTFGMQPVAPSAIPDPYLNVLPRELSVSEIEEIVEKFVKAAIRAQNAGYDGVEIHGAHGYLVGQFMSPFSNKRNDLYGGDINGRMRFPVEIVRGIKEATKGSFPVVFRFSADEFVEDGNHLEEAKQIARILQDAGVDALDVSSGVYASMPTILEPMKYPEGWRAYLAEKIKKEVHIPVITVGVIRSPETAEGILTEGKADFVALGRTLIADPEWPLKAMEDRTEDIRKCITCNVWCIGERVFKNLHVRCTVNPVAGREHEYPGITSTLSPGHFAIIGGGPAGMEAARVLSTAGHRVELFEREPELGGQVKMAAVPPGKEKIRWATDYLQTQINKLGVEVHLNTLANADTLQGMNLDAVIVATGAKPIIPDIPGVHNPNVTTAWDLLAGRYQVGNKVVIVGGGNVGCETALFLKHQGIDVTVVEMEDELAVDTEPISRMSLLEELKNSGVHTLTRLAVREIKPDGVLAVDSRWNESWLPCTHVVLSVGATPENQLEEELRQRGMRVFVIGDAKKSRKLNHAIFDGFMTAHRITQAETLNQPYRPFPVQREYKDRQQEQYLQ